MTIDITDLIDTPPDEFEEKLKAFQGRHPQFFKEPTEAKMTKTERIAELELQVKALTPRHIERNVIGSGMGEWTHGVDCITPCPGCNHEERVERMREAR